MRKRTLPLWLLPLLSTACGDLEVRTTRNGDAVPAALTGAWQGSWQSDEGTGSGSLEIRIQEFQGEPVVQVVIDNPCLLPQVYQLVIEYGRISLLLDGEPVFTADEAGEGTLQGSYGCEADSGSWSATRTGELPTPLDLSGPWSGRVFVPGQFEQPIDLHMTQSVRAGGLSLDGVAELPGVVPFPLPIVGGVEFGETDFQLVLRTLPGVEPSFVITGIGSREPVEVPFGVVDVQASAALPFSQGLVEIAPLAQIDVPDATTAATLGR